MRFLILSMLALLFTAACNTACAQGFLFGGYTAGKYLYPEPTPQLLAAKFNLGWDISLNEDQTLIQTEAGSGNYTLDKPMEWKSIPMGSIFGFTFFESEKKIGIMTRLNFLNNRSGGERTNLSTGVKEKLSLKTRSLTVSFNFVYVPNKFIQPYAGLDVGRNSFRYWYDNGTEHIKNQRIGYDPKIGGTFKPGGKGFSMRLNAGAIVRIFQTETIGLQAIAQYQYVIPRLDGSINTWNGDSETPVTPDYYFRHDNVSLSLLLTYQF